MSPTEIPRASNDRQDHRPNQDSERRLVEGQRSDLPVGQEPRGIEHHIADADKIARSGTADEPVRNTPPAGAWNDTASD